jgi:hypothetical protein
LNGRDLHDEQKRSAPLSGGDFFHRKSFLSLVVAFSYPGSHPTFTNQQAQSFQHRGAL